MPGNPSWDGGMILSGLVVCSVFESLSVNQLSSDRMSFPTRGAARTALLAGKGADKMLLFMHMSDFNIFNQPPMAVTKETITILSTVPPPSRRK